MIVRAQVALETGRLHGGCLAAAAIGQRIDASADGLWTLSRGLAREPSLACGSSTCPPVDHPRISSPYGLAGSPLIPHLYPMELVLPQSLNERLSPRAVALHLAIGLFISEEATLGQAAETAAMTQAQFLRELGSRHIPIHYGPEELAADLQAVELLTKS